MRDLEFCDSGYEDWPCFQTELSFQGSSGLERDRRNRDQICKKPADGGG